MPISGVSIDDAEITKLLWRLEEDAYRAAGKAITAAAKPVVAAARANVPVRFGNLKASIGGLVRRYRRSRTIMAIIGARRGFESVARNPRTGKPMKVNPEKYLHLVELGTAPHFIGSGSQLQANATVYRKITGKSVQHGVRHPGSQGKRFLTRAWESQKATVIETIKNSLKESLRQMVR